MRGVDWFFSKHKFNKGVEDFQYALELEPDNAFLVAAIGKGALLTGDFDDAISQYQAALILEPLVPEFYWYLGKAYRSAGRLADAEASFRTMANLSGSAQVNFDLWETLFLKGEFEAALAESDNLFTRTVTHYASGNEAKADENLAELIEVNADSYPYSISKAYAYRGDADKAFEWLDYSLENNGSYPWFILSETAFHGVYSDPRWKLFREKLGLREYWLERSPDWGL